MNDLPVSAANFCYRHPGRQSFILCQRCGRTICTECQTQAAVGVICPECMKIQRKNAPRTKPAVLTRLTGSGQPTVTYALIALTVFMFVLQWIPGLGITQRFAYVPALTIVEPWRMLTSVFLHSQGGLPFHVLLNMYALWLFGPMLEGMLGRGRFLALYLISGFAGSVGVLVLAPSTSVVGASGALFGLMGAFLIIQRGLGGNSKQLLVLLGINVVVSFIPGIAWQAHLGGIVGGALIGFVLMRTRRPNQKGVQIVLIAAVGVLFVAIAVLRILSLLAPVG
ncbi:rhomboid family intramembrane serine protease [Cryobacterium sp. Hb1]|nr:rhomboid family intramembrane serine protease [Cryobacterium sp. Hb1]TFD69204.1 rhomboid family intramembrane serine protease [Cryobacterium sp. Hb1]